MGEMRHEMGMELTLEEEVMPGAGFVLVLVLAGMLHLHGLDGEGGGEWCDLGVICEHKME